MRTTIPGIILALGLFLGVSHQAFALTISPAKIEITGDPGTTVHGEIKILNEQQESKSFFSSSENFEPSGDTGAPRFVGGGSGLASWISTETQITLAPQEVKVVPFSITIPQGTEPGGYFAAIFFGSQNPDTHGTGEVSVGGKIGALVLLRVSGPVSEQAGLLDFQAQDNKRFFVSLPISFTYHVNNLGGDRIVPLGSIAVKNFGIIPGDILKANTGEGSVLPKSTRKFETVWGGEGPKDESFLGMVAYEWQNFHFGWYVAKLHLVWGITQQSGELTYSFFVFPWQLLLVLLVIGGILWLGISRGLKKYKESIIKQAMIQK